MSDKLSYMEIKFRFTAQSFVLGILIQRPIDPLGAYKYGITIALGVVAGTLWFGRKHKPWWIE